MRGRLAKDALMMVAGGIGVGGWIECQVEDAGKDGEIA